MDKSMIEKMLKATMAEVVSQTCRAADKQLSPGADEKMAERFYSALAELAREIHALPDLPASQKGS